MGKRRKGGRKRKVVEEEEDKRREKGREMGEKHSKDCLIYNQKSISNEIKIEQYEKHVLQNKFRMLKILINIHTKITGMRI